jgi:hypothetical protein
MTKGTENPPGSGPAAGKNSGGKPSDNTMSLYEAITKHSLEGKPLIHCQGEVALSVDIRKDIDDCKADSDLATTLKATRMAPEEVTRKDLEDLEAKMNAQNAKLMAEMHAHIAELTAAMRATNAEFTAAITKLMAMMGATNAEMVSLMMEGFDKFSQALQDDNAQGES